MTLRPFACAGDETQKQRNRVGKLRRLRKERHLTLEQVAKLLGVSESTVSRWETGTLFIPADAIERLSRLYGVRPVELFADDPREEASQV